jgi:TPR repeat protein
MARKMTGTKMPQAPFASDENIGYLVNRIGRADFKQPQKHAVESSNEGRIMGNAVAGVLFKLTCATAFLLASAGAKGGLLEAENAYKNKNYKVAQQQLEPLVNNGVAAAQFLVGLMFDNGDGVAQNYKRAMEWYLKAAKQGYAPAQCNLGVIYEKGTGVNLSEKEAAFWYRKAAEQGNASAQFNLGLMYYYGRGFEIRRSYKTAASWFLKAAELGNASAQNSLGKMFENGQSLQVSLVQAYKWYSLAAEAGNNEALTNQIALEEKMAPELVVSAQDMAREWRAKHK